MSKPVRIRNDVAAQVEGRAAAEMRSFANMVEVLLLSALSDGEPLAEPKTRAVFNDRFRSEPEWQPERSAKAESVPPSAHDVPMRPHMRKDKPAIECGTRVRVGMKCVECGRIV